MTETVILPDSPEAAKLVTKDLWKSRRGILYADEDVARWDGATHVPCKECGTAARKPYILCDSCRVAAYRKKWEALESKPWDGTTPICIYPHGSMFFFDQDELDWYLEDEDLNVADVLLVHCDPQFAFQVEPLDLYVDVITDDCHELPAELDAAFERLNETIANFKEPLSWVPGGVRVEI